MIRKIGDKYVLFTKDGKQRLGTHTTRAQAVQQERVIEQKKRTREHRR